jgi:hypothetical protein
MRFESREIVAPLDFESSSRKGKEKQESRGKGEEQARATATDKTRRLGCASARPYIYPEHRHLWSSWRRILALKGALYHSRYQFTNDVTWPECNHTTVPRVRTEHLRGWRCWMPCIGSNARANHQFIQPDEGYIIARGSKAASSVRCKHRCHAADPSKVHAGDTEPVYTPDGRRKVCSVMSCDFLHHQGRLPAQSALSLLFDPLLMYGACLQACCAVNGNWGLWGSMKVQDEQLAPRR